jgi:hypothetical protein
MLQQVINARIHLESDNSAVWRMLVVITIAVDTNTDHFA